MNIKDMHWNYGTVFEVEITGEEYLICDKFSKEMWATEKKGNYGSGVMNTKDDPYNVTRSGCLGEVAFHKYTGLGYNFNYMQGGDKFDFKHKGIKFDIKTVIGFKKTGYIYAVSESGKPITLDKDVYVFCSKAEERREDNYARVLILGYQTSKDIKSLKIIKSPRGEHKNYEIDLYNLKKFTKATKWVK